MQRLYTYTKANKSDIDTILNLNKTLFHNEMSGEDIRIAFNDSRYLIRTLKLVKNQKVIGYLIGTRSFDEFEIYQVAIDSFYQHKGLATFLLKAFLIECKDSIISKVFLEVRNNNTNAIKLYEKVGFKYLFTRKQYYKDGTDCLVYEKEIVEENEL